MKNTTDIRHQAVRTIRLSAPEIARILDDLDATATGPQTSRRESRYKYRLHEIVIVMQQPGLSAPMAFIVPTRNLSARGLAFLHGGFVHPGTVCVAQLVTTRGASQKVVGTVRRCRHVQNNVHEVAVLFQQAVDPAIFCHHALTFRVLLAEDDPSVVRLAKLHLGRLNCEVAHVDEGQAALELAAETAFDLILLDMDLPGRDGYAVARELRARRHAGVIVAGFAGVTAEDRKRSLQAGCDQCLEKPFKLEQLEDVIASLHNDPLLSAFQNDPNMRELTAEFVRDLERKMALLEHALSAEDWAALNIAVRDLKVEGQGFGFDEIAALASNIENALARNESIETIGPSTRALIRLCARARSAAS